MGNTVGGLCKHPQVQRLRPTHRSFSCLKVLIFICCITPEQSQDLVVKKKNR